LVRVMGAGRSHPLQDDPAADLRPLEAAV
jgi:hypothetical protein